MLHSIRLDLLQEYRREQNNNQTAPL